MSEFAVISSTTIRAPTFWRVVAIIDPCFLDFESSEFGGRVLESIKQDRMQRACTLFPTKDVHELAASIIILARCYQKHPEIFNKIKMLCMATFATAMMSSLAENAKSLSATEKRAKEIYDLNDYMFKLGEKISGIDVYPMVKLMKPGFNELHPDSEFAFFCVNAKSVTI
jgi:hypothetical protein